METQLLPGGLLSAAPVHVLGVGLPLNLSSRHLCEPAGRPGGHVAPDRGTRNSQCFLSDGHGAVEKVCGTLICGTPTGTPRAAGVSVSVSPPVSPSGRPCDFTDGEAGAATGHRSRPVAGRFVFPSTRPLFVLSSASNLHVFILLQGKTRMLSGVYGGWGVDVRKEPRWRV